MAGRSQHARSTELGTRRVSLAHGVSLVAMFSGGSGVVVVLQTHRCASLNLYELLTPVHADCRTYANLVGWGWVDSRSARTMFEQIWRKLMRRLRWDAHDSNDAPPSSASPPAPQLLR